MIDESLHRGAGAVMGSLRGVTTPRHYGDPAAEYEAATGAVGVRDRSHRTRLRVAGRQPSAMLKGVVTGRIPGALTAAGDAHRGRAEPSAVLTPKGRIVSDLLLWREPGEEEALWLDVPAASAAPLLEHLGRYIPPRFATVEDRTDATGTLTVVGPDAARLLSLEALGLRVEEDDLAGAGEGDLWWLGGLAVIRIGTVRPPAWDVVGERASLAALWSRLTAAGASPFGSGVWEALRLEAGRPASGADFDQDTLLPETGLHTRVVDHAKGCYTGQEVVVRIRDRGHVNRHLRRLRLGEGPMPAPGTELWTDGGDRPVGVVTSVAESPREGALALAYVRREVEPPGPVHVGAPDGVPAAVEALPD